MGRCLSCGKKDKGEMIDTNSYLAEGVTLSFAGLFCKDCINDKEICNYCGVPSEIVYVEEGFETMNYCQECFDEVEGYLQY